MKKLFTISKNFFFSLFQSFILKKKKSNDGNKNTKKPKVHNYNSLFQTYNANIGKNKN
jgi:hypothetical protein